MFYDNIHVLELPSFEYFEKVIDENTNTSLCALPFEAEIKYVIFSLNKDDSAGPDGFTALFYQKNYTSLKLILWRLW